MKENQISFFTSLQGRLLLSLGVPTILIICSIVTITSINSFSSAKAQAEHAIEQAAALAALEIERRNANAIRTAKIMALAQEEGMFGNRVASSKFARRVLLEHPEFTGAYFGYDKNADQQDAQYTAQQYSGKIADQAGRFLPYWYRDGDSIALAPLTLMETGLYYDGLRKRYYLNNKAQGLVTEPYIYSDKMLVEQTYPITKNGTFIGIAGVDRSLNDMIYFLKSIKQDTGRDLFLISREGNFIASTIASDELTSKEVANSVYSETFKYLENGQKNRLQQSQDPIDGNDYYFVSHAIETGEWILILRQSEHDVMDPILAELRTTLIVAGFGILVIIAISIWFARSISQRIQHIMRKADLIAQGDTHKQENLPNKIHDEIAILDISLDKVLQSYDEISTACGAIAEGDFSKQMNKRSDNDTVMAAINLMAQRRQEIEALLQERTTRIIESTHMQNIDLDHVAVAMNQMSAATREVSSLATSSAENAQQAVSSIESTKFELITAVDEVKLQSADISSASTAITKVFESSNNISGIIEVINMIAEQTNLLALNAAIEAARAGEQGQGFAVVADEVRSLALKTRDSTQEISSLISQLQNQVEETVSTVSQSEQRSQYVVEKSEVALNSLGNVADLTSKISHSMTQVAAAVEEQSCTTAEITNNISSVSAAATALASFTAQ
jgi:methyl-accepting chemotaxis protein